MEPLTLAALSALIWKIGSVVKQLIARDFSASLTQVIIWVIGIGVALLAREADITEGLVIPGGPALGAADTASIILLGIILGSLASVSYDFKSAFDGSDSAKEPSLGVGTTPPP
jgi:hypothetical protein